VWHLLAVDFGRAGFQLLTRFVMPVVCGALLFDLYAPRHLATYPLVAVSMTLAVIVCFACRHIVEVASYWLLDVRGPTIAWVLVSGLLSGMYFPLWLVPEPWSTLLVYGTPLPAIIQTPMDILVERAAHPWQSLAVQAGWAAVMVTVARTLQRRGERTLVVQGG
jgi:ABC-2 type transport system permease protein